MKLKKGDHVVVLQGKHRGERADVLKTLPSRNAVILDSLNIAKRHTKQRGSTMQAGIIEKVLPMDVSNVALWCAGHKGPAKSALRVVDGAKLRVCRKCGEAL